MRVQTGVAKHRRTKRILKQVVRAGAMAYIGRRLKKRQFRSLWIVRLNAAARQHGLNYSRLIHGLQKAGVTVDRKELSRMACEDGPAFDRFVETAKAAL